MLKLFEFFGDNLVQKNFKKSKKIEKNYRQRKNIWYNNKSVEGKS